MSQKSRPGTFLLARPNYYCEMTNKVKQVVLNGGGILAIIFAIFGIGAAPFLTVFYFGLFRGPEQYYLKSVTIKDLICRTGNHIQFGLLAPFIPVVPYFILGLVLFFLFRKQPVLKRYWEYIIVFGVIVSLWVLIACWLANREFYCNIRMHGM